jgi:phage terminase small subunit
MAKGHAAVALKTLADIAKDGESESARVSASVAILDRAYGKPSQSVQHSGSVGTYDLSRMTDEQLDKLESILGPLALAGGDQSGEGEAEG